MSWESRSIDRKKEVSPQQIYEGWQVIDKTRWWHTSFTSVPWAYPPLASSRRRFARPLYYHTSLYRRCNDFACANVVPESQMAHPPCTAGDCSVVPEPDEDTLNPDLIGVKAAIDVLTLYEKSVGFSYSSCPKIDHRELRYFDHDWNYDYESHSNAEGAVDISVEIDEDEVKSGRGRWRALVEDLFEGPLSDDSAESSANPSLESSLHLPSPAEFYGLQRTASALSSLDFTDSEVFSMPSTPKARAAEVDVIIKGVSPSSSSDSGLIHNRHRSYSQLSSPSRPLNATATSFVPISASLGNYPTSPSSSSTDAPETYANFSFASLTPHPPTVTFKKDEQGFYTYADSSRPQSQSQANDATLLPAFLQEPPQRRKPRSSKTRQMVDRLRSQSYSSGPEEGFSLPTAEPESLTGKDISHGPTSVLHDPHRRSRSSVSEDLGTGADTRYGSAISTPSIEEDDDGWIDIAGPNNKSKAKRTRDLFLALTRRRTDSSSSGEAASAKGLAPESSSGGSRILHSEDAFSSSPSPSPVSTSPGNDGWIEGHSFPAPQAVVRRKTPANNNANKSYNNSTHLRRPSFTQHHSASSSMSDIPLPLPPLPPYAGMSILPHQIPVHYPPATPYFYAPYHPGTVPYPAYIPVPPPFPLPLAMHMPRPLQSGGAPILQFPSTASAGPTYPHHPLPLAAQQWPSS